MTEMQVKSNAGVSCKRPKKKKKKKRKVEEEK
eukprot:CAMPEP_0170506668 /NCGR_PEP_ID=MMETSP0208-20121228/55814_1 /TAXON_ID=197538 /ORGANISM="Strombidium inclinatum, Strain S3" /LENGTH=31 /DNA_ID= /DNA_START= /DNA_END= /DNA_ORIENTATION=